MTTVVDHLTGQDPTGRSRQWDIQLRHRSLLPGAALITRQAMLPDGTRLYYRTVLSTQGRAQDQAITHLDNEIRCLIRLGLTFPDWADVLFPRLIGYNVDAEVPYALVTPYIGVPASEATPRLLDTQRIAFARHLFRALTHIAAAGIVHGAVSLQALNVSQTTVQFVAFESGVLTGEPHAGTSRLAHPGDDIADAGLLLHKVFTGWITEPVAGPSSVPLLAGPLSDLFAADRDARPSAADVLARLGGSTADIKANPVDVRLAGGYADFDRVREQKLCRPVERATASSVGGIASGGERPNGHPHRRAVTAMMIVVVAIFTVAALLFVLGVLP